MKKMEEDLKDYNQKSRIDLQNYKFEFSTKSDVTPSRSYLRFFVLFLILLGSLVLPTLIAIGFWDLIDLDIDIPW